MDLKSRKRLLEIYGLLRMIFGLAQIVGLAGGFFLMELMVRWSPQTSAYVFEEDVLILIYLAVFIRGLFHTITSIGIARLQGWGRSWLLYGWPVAAIVTLGIINTIAQEWVREGYIHGLGEIISWPAVLVWLAVIAADYTFVNQTIRLAADNDTFEKQYGPRFENRNLALVGFIVIISFCIVLFVTKPVKQGFHEGFYKSRGATQSKEVVKPKTEPVQEVSESEPTSVLEEKPAVVLPTVVAVEKVQVQVADESHGDEQPQRLAAKVEDKPVEGGSPFCLMIGFLAGLCLVAALFYDMMQVVQGGQQPAGSVFFYILLACGFLLLTVYGLGMKLLPVYTAGILAAILSVGILLLKQKS